MPLTKVRRGGTDTGISDSSDATAISIDSSENVGIGTNSPSSALHVDSSNDGPIFDSGGTGNTNHALLVRDSGNNQLLRINNNGNVGFNTTSPPSYGSTFTVAQVNNTATGIVQANNSTNSITTEIESEGTRGAVGTRTNHEFIIKTNQTERVRSSDTKFLTSQKHVEHAKSLGNIQREVVGFYEANMSTSYNTIFTVGTGNIHLGYFYEVIFFGGDWGGHSSARAYKRGFINGYNGYTGHNSIEQSGVHNGSQIIENVTWTGSGNSQVSNYQLKLNTGSVGARIYVRLVGTINTFTITN